MPFCPKCRAEYVEGVKTCPDCQVALVEKLPPKDDRSDEDYVEMVELREVPNEVAGVMMKGVLESGGITVILRAAKIPMYDGIASTWSTSYWGKLLVAKDELEMSRKILDDYLSSLETENTEEKEQ